MTVQRMHVGESARHLPPRTPQAIDLVHFRLAPTRIAITPYDEHGQLNYAHRDRYRVVANGDDWIDVTEDEAEADRIMGIAP